MMRTIVVVVLSTCALIAGQAPDAARVLATARQALGGDAALDNIAAFTASGTLMRTLGARSTMSGVDISCVLPDKFVQVSQQFVDGPPGRSVSIRTTVGFNGDDPINEVSAPGAPIPPFISAGPEPRTPEEIAAARQRRARIYKRQFMQMALPLFAASPSTYPIAFTAVRTVQLPSGAADVIDGTTPDGEPVHLFIDATSHLPVRVTWTAKPTVVFAGPPTLVAVNSRTGQVSSSQPPATPPPGDPTANLPLVEWSLTLEDYRTADGLTWPHRLTTRQGSGKWEELLVKKFKINPKIDPKVFAPKSP